MNYNSLQWRESCVGQVSVLRPQVPSALLKSMSIDAWIEHGTREVDPVRAAKAWSETMEEDK